MDQLLIILILFFIVTITIISILFIINDYIYPKIKPNISLKTNISSSANGNPGNKGIYSNNYAKNGIDGEDGKKGADGKKGKKGDSGIYGDVGKKGDKGISGPPGKIGEHGNPSNSIVPILNRYEMSETDSYILQDYFSFDSTKYQISLYANFDNNTRFVLFPGEHIKSQPGFIENLIYPENKVQDLAGGAFFSNIRIAIGYGRGDKNSKDRSDDTIFYISPPISRRSYLFRYKINKKFLDPSSNNIDIKYPISKLDNTKEFYFFKSEFGTEKSLNPSESLNKYHLVKGIGRYELVVNTYPILPSNYKFNYRIIEEFNNNKDFDFALPSITFPFNSNYLTYKNEENNYSLTVSNRFDLNRVIERDITFSNNPWKQTNKTNVSLSAVDSILKVQYDNTYSSLEKVFADSINNINTVDNLYYYYGYDEINETFDSQEKLALILSVKVKRYDGKVLDRNNFYFRMLKYISPVPTKKYNNLEKFYMQFRLINVINYTTMSTFDKFERIITYGEDYSFDLINFNSVYTKSLFFSQFYALIGMEYKFHLDGNIFDPLFIIDTKYPIKVGYTTYDTKQRYTINVLPQKINLKGSTGGDWSYCIHIPLYGYKKE